MNASKKPTKKVLTGALVALGAVLAHLVATGELDGAEQGGLAATAIYAISAYLKANDGPTEDVPEGGEVIV